MPFDENDVRGVSSMLMGTKDRNSAQTIGRFGMGFKSVFKYTYQQKYIQMRKHFELRIIFCRWKYRMAGIIEG